MNKTVSSNSEDNFFSNEVNLDEALAIAGKHGANYFNITMKNAEEGKSMPVEEPHIIKQELKQKIKTVNSINSVKYTKRNDLSFSTNNPMCAKQIAALKSFLNVNITTSSFVENFTTKFLIHDISIKVKLADLCSEIMESNQHEVDVKELRRFYKQGSPATRSPVLVTVYGTSIPDTIVIWCNRKRIKTFIDRPKKCTKCHRIGHTERFCSANEKICIACQINHDGECKSEDKKTNCINCGNNHDSGSKECPKYKEEEEILKFKSKNHLTRNEAIRRIEINKEMEKKKKEEKSYAKVTLGSSEDAKAQQIENKQIVLIMQSIKTLEISMKSLQSQLSLLINALPKEKQEGLSLKGERIGTSPVRKKNKNNKVNNQESDENFMDASNSM